MGLVLLAAGASTRLGHPKQLLPFHGATLLRHMAEVALASPCRPVAVVLGYEAERMAREISDLEVAVIVEPGWNAGQGRSLSAGLGALLASHPSLSAVIVMLVDQPAVTSAHLAALVRLHQRGAHSIVTSAYDETYGVPALFGQEHFPTLLKLEGPHGARHVIRHASATIASVPLPGGDFDVDLAEDLARLYEPNSNFRR
ncbi:nucleotidyltransferase family protein [bacterium]|nr:nucleotidyltransferase family protein [bacterium]